MKGYWAEDPEFSAADWQREVAEGETREGYRAWVEGERKAKAAEVANIAPYEED